MNTCTCMCVYMCVHVYPCIKKIHVYMVVYPCIIVSNNLVIIYIIVSNNSVIIYIVIYIVVSNNLHYS